MPVLTRLAACLLLALGAVAGTARAQPPPVALRSEVPIREVILGDGTRRYAVRIKVGAAEFDAGLDSGSAGLRILPGALGPGDAAEGRRDETYAYGSGARYEGVAGDGVLAIGAASGRAPMQLIHTIGCVPAIPRCPVSRIPAAQYGIQGDGLANEGFKAILGTNMANANIANPLMALGVRRWIIELPRPGEHSPGRLILNPTDEEAAGYAVVPVSTAYERQQGGLHDAVLGCAINVATHAKVCGALLMDTGAPGIIVMNSDIARAWANETAAVLAVFDAQGHMAAGESLVLGRREHASHFSVRPDPRSRGVAIYAGLAPYFAFSVLYDAAHQTIGLKARPRAPGGPEALSPDLLR